MSTTIERATERDYIRHEVEALFAAQDRGDDADVRSTAATLQQILHIIGLGAGDAGETCSRLYIDQGQYRLPDRERASAAALEAVGPVPSARSRLTQSTPTAAVTSTS